MTAARDTPFSPARQIVVRRATPITGASRRERVLDARGRWSNVDFYVSAPTAWAGVDVHVEVWAYAGGTKTLLIRVDIANISRDTFDSGKFGCKLASIRGTPCDGFELLIENSSLADLPEAEFTAVLWGTESTPEAFGELMNDTMANVAAPIRDSRLMVWNSALGLWQRWDGAVTSGGSSSTELTTAATRTSVADSAASQTLLAANANRRFAIVHNDSTEILYLALGAAAASTSSFTARLVPQAMYEAPPGYTGAIQGIWAADAAGNARITEVTTV